MKTIIKALSMMTVLLLMTACSNNDESTTEESKKGPSVLSVYVYSPEHPIPTRGTNGEVNVSNA